MRFSKMLEQEFKNFSLLEIMVIALVIMVLYLVFKQFKGNFSFINNHGLTAAQIANMDPAKIQCQNPKFKNANPRICNKYR